MPYLILCYLKFSIQQRIASLATVAIIMCDCHYVKFNDNRSHTCENGCHLISIANCGNFQAKFAI